MKKSRLNKEDGVSLAAALLFFTFCSFCAARLLAAASAETGKAVLKEPKDQKRFAVESAAGFLRDELLSAKNTVKIVECDREDGESEIRFYYVGVGGDTEDVTTWQEADEYDEEILVSMLRELYTPMGGETDPAQTAEKELKFSVKDSGGSEFPELSVEVKLCMDPDYKLTAVISDTGSEREHERCTRRLVAPAEVFTEQWESGEETETASASNAEVSEGVESIQVTTIKWNRAVIEKEFLEPWEMDETE